MDDLRTEKSHDEGQSGPEWEESPVTPSPKADRREPTEGEREPPFEQRFRDADAREVGHPRWQARYLKQELSTLVDAVKARNRYLRRVGVLANPMTEAKLEIEVDKACGRLPRHVTDFVERELADCEQVQLHFTDDEYALAGQVVLERNAHAVLSPMAKMLQERVSALIFAIDAYNYHRDNDADTRTRARLCCEMEKASAALPPKLARSFSLLLGESPDSWWAEL